MHYDRGMERVRLDKWLWAARFFRTRALAKAAIEGGKVKVDGQRPKVSKELTVGASLSIRRGFDEECIEVLALSDQRGPASVAQTLYRETADSIERRETARLQRKAAAPLTPRTKPDKKSRRLIHRFKRDPSIG